MNNSINVVELARKSGLHLRIVTSVKSFDTYNSFFNIYDSFDEPCRRIVVLTKYEDLEEVYDENPDEPIVVGKCIMGNYWLKDYSLTTNPESIYLEEILISEEVVDSILKELKN
ncbi:hypothetical protein [Clostridium folliculivorans]|uniref:Uncharacterized protein n=1 Tax=Clostridium folliculivorans TaxID=2886038 RepID=A0A9W5Y4W7_9CLOT|nr:hypothetical protein [Clostridium folliculivorans]GKU26585.1 hypothetical protein CFOLD11_34120 [Clostridium folliculivorans]GKU28983.1 hypothetical protein CFB3_10890 [Clostridium folliculivorans]